jgi:hypothetical protein
MVIRSPLVYILLTACASSSKRISSLKGKSYFSHLDHFTSAPHIQESADTPPSCRPDLNVPRPTNFPVVEFIRIELRLHSNMHVWITEYLVKMQYDETKLVYFRPANLEAGGGEICWQAGGKVGKGGKNDEEGDDERD